MLALALCPAVATAQAVNVRLDAEQLRITATQLNFLSGEPLQRLHNGIAVNFSFNVRISKDRYGKAISETTYRFIVSYDIFEEKFAVNRLSPNPRSVTHLSGEAAEMWCLDSIALSIGNLSPDQSFWIILEYHSEEPRSSESSADSGASIIGQLIDVFSRKNQRQESRGSVAGGPFRLSELRKAR